MILGKLEIKNRIEETERLPEFVDEVSEKAGIDMALSMQLNLALEEALVNVVQYAYPVGVEGDISLTAKLIADDKVLFSLKDSGRPFDPTKKEDPDLDSPLEERPIGGLGIFLVKNIMTEVSYHRTKDGENVLSMVKQFEKQA